MPNVTYDDRSFLVDGQRVWLVSGSMHYFRVPHELWRDRLVKAKRAGLNCISTYVAWNFHEPTEGEWHMDGDRDILQFVRLCQELGLYVILRPGPYICAEWDSGGLPGWLNTKTGISYRTNNASYTHYFDKYFRNILPRLAEYQVSNGGPIIAIQNENEYVMTTMPDRKKYLGFISQLFSRAGFDVPVITCNLGTRPLVDDAVDCVNTWSHAVRMLKKMRIDQPDAPLIVTEFWCGWFDHWGGEHEEKSADDTVRHAMEILGCGGQVNYYMWHGGTNFGFWGSRLAAGDDTYQTTSYDYDAPLAEGGGLTEKYYKTRVVNLLANHMGEYIADCSLYDPGVDVVNNTNVLNIAGLHGRWAVITNGGNADITSAQISLPEARELEVLLEPFGAVAIPVEVRLDDSHMLDYTNCTPMGLFGDELLLLTAQAGAEVRVSINGKELVKTMPQGDQPKVVDHEGLSIGLVNSRLAQRTWPMEDVILFGPDFVGETDEDIRLPDGANSYARLTFAGKLSVKKVNGNGLSPKPNTPELDNFSRLCVCKEPDSQELPWEPIEGPTDVDQLGVHQGYVWYRVDIEHSRARKRNLFFPQLEDRAMVYCNGEFVGIWGRGEDAQRSPISVSMKKGVNRLVLLVDNLGRFNYGPRVGEIKGLYGPVYDAKKLRTRKFKVKKQEGFQRRVIPRKVAYLVPELESQPLYHAELSIPLNTVTPLHMMFRELPYHVAVVVNERMVEFFAHQNRNFGDVLLTNELKKGSNKIRLMLWGEVDAKLIQDQVTFYSLMEELSLEADWSMRKWDVPEEEGPLVGKNQPAWYVSRFDWDGSAAPLFLQISGARKGQIYLNGHNCGRFWNVGPQQYYYLPEPWLTEHNELKIFEEQGNIPSRSKLVIRPLGPYRE